MKEYILGQESNGSLRHQVNVAKRDAEQKILAILQEFHQKTGLLPAEIDVNSIETTNCSDIEQKHQMLSLVIRCTLDGE